MTSKDSRTTFSGWVRVSHTSKHRYRCYAVARSDGAVEFHNSLSDWCLLRAPRGVAYAKSVKLQELKSRDPNFVITFHGAKRETRFRAEPSSAVKSWIEALKKTSSTNKTFFKDDVHESLEKSNSLETRLTLLHDAKLLKIYRIAQERVRDAAALNSTQFDKRTSDAFFNLARASSPSTSSNDDDEDEKKHIIATDAMAAYISLAVNILKDPSIAKRLPAQTPPMVPEPVARSELEIRCVRPKTMSHYAFWPVLPLYGHGITYGDVSICIQAASLDPQFVWTCYACVDRALPESLLVPGERTGNERSRRFWHALQWGVPVTIPLRAPKSLSRIVLALEAREPKDKKRKHTVVVSHKIDLDTLESPKQKVWGAFLPGVHWVTKETNLTANTMREVETWINSQNHKLYDFTNNAARKEKKGNILFDAVGGITNLGVGVMGQGLSLVGSGVSGTVGILGGTFNAVADVGGNIPILGKGVKFIGHTVGDGVNLVGEGIGTGINVVSTGLTETPNMIGKGIGEGFKGIKKGVSGLAKSSPLHKLFVENEDGKTKHNEIKTKMKLKLIVTSHRAAERCCCLAYPSFCITNSMRRDRGGDVKSKSQLEMDAEAISKLEHALGVLGTAVKYSPMSLVSLFTSAVANFKWLSSAVTVVFIASSVYLYPYMGKALLVGILGSVTSTMFVVALLLILANKLFRKKRTSGKMDMETTKTSRKIAKALFWSRSKKIKEGPASEAVKFAVDLFLPILRLRLRRIATWLALSSVLLLSSAYAMSTHGMKSYWGWLADTTLFMVGLMIIFRRVAPVRAVTEYIQRVMVAWGV